MLTIKLNPGRESFIVMRDGLESRWEYDVVEIKLLSEELERSHGLREGNQVKSPTITFLQAFANLLSAKGLEGCNTDVAFKVFNVVNAQFVKISNDLSAQVQSIANEG